MWTRRLNAPAAVRGASGPAAEREHLIRSTCRPARRHFSDNSGMRSTVPPPLPPVSSHFKSRAMLTLGTIRVPVYEANLQSGVKMSGVCGEKRMTDQEKTLNEAKNCHEESAR